jgi:chemotaxis protein methyltransferase CheR
VNIDLSIEDFIKLRDFLYQKVGIFFEEKKIYFLKKRLQMRMEELNLEEPSLYIRLLKFNDPAGKELQEIVNLITTNETYFFREFEHLRVFAEECIPYISTMKKDFDKTIKIWSAGCSTGEEPYTLAIILMEILDNYKSWNLLIKATDIDVGVLEKAVIGKYDARAIKDVPKEYLEKYFTLDEGSYFISPEVKSLVEFGHLNLMDKTKMRLEMDYDFIFCKNVLIYFNDSSRKEVVDQFYCSLNKNGFIFLGHAESVGRISTAFTLKKMGGSLVYSKE